MSTAGSVNSTTADAHVYKGDNTYTVAQAAAVGTAVSSGAEIFVGQQASFGGIGKTIWRAVLYFDLSSLGQSITVHAASLTITCGTDFSATDFTIRMVDGSDAEATLATSDYGDLLSATIAIADTNTTNTWTGTKTFNLNAIGLALLQGSTSTVKKLCLRSEEDINISAPTGSERAGFATFDDGTEASRPLLTLLYDAVTTAAPTVTTELCTDITGTTATGNGRVESGGTSAVTQHGHCWNTTGNPTTSDSKTENGASDGGNFTSAVTGLTTAVRYYIVAYATNSTDTAYGEAIAFRGGDSTSQMRRNIAIVEDGLHYFDKYGNERVLKGSIVT